MLARLWWKEARMFWPVWLLLVLAAAGVQWVLLESLEPQQVGNGALTPVALGWAVLYALVAGAAAFAGERENWTLLFLDILPVGRRTLWVGKASFALVSTFVLALALALMASLGTHRRVAPFDYGTLAVGFGMLLIEAVAWGLFWSAVLENVLLAGTLAIVCLAMVSGLMERGLVRDVPGLLTNLHLRLPLALGLLVTSGSLVTGRPRPRGVVWSLRGDPVVEGRLRRPSSGPVLQSLAWQTYREARATWLTLGLVNFVGPLLMAAGLRRGNDAAEAAFSLSVLTSVVAGVSVFAPEGRARTFRFYLHHGVRPGVVWTVKVLVWGAALLVYGLFLTAALLRSCDVAWGSGPSLARRILLIWAYGFTLGQLCGLVFRRGITAGLIALAGILALLMPQLGLISDQMIPEASLAFSPLILLAISRAWAGDGMNDQAGAGRWVRLALLLVVSLGLLLAAYAGYRVGSVPDIGPPFDTAVVRPAPIPTDLDAEAIYWRAIQGLRPPAEGPWNGDEQVARVIREGWDSEARLAVDWWEKNQEAIALTRRGAALPIAGVPWIQGPEIADAAAPRVAGELALARLMALDVRQRQDRGDLAGAWDDLLVLLHLGRQMSFRPATSAPALVATVQQQADRLGMDWAADPRQAPEPLRSALEDLRRLPANAPHSDRVKVQYVRMERVLALPDDELRRLAEAETAASPGVEHLVLSLGITPSWERQRSLRVVRLLAAERLQWVDFEPWLRSPLRTAYWEGFTDLVWPQARPSWQISAEQLATFASGTPLVRLSYPFRTDHQAWDRELVERRALIQILALRSWQLRHGGQFPEALADLVPSELDELPSDPYSGRPFGYIRSKGQELRAPGSDDLLFGVRPPEVPRATRPGQWILYSVGPDRIDDEAGSDYDPTQGHGDITFSLPPGDARTEPAP